jgi:hypothetical protein
MAIDTDDRKFSAINIGSPWRGVNSIPSGALDAAEMQSLAFLYTEIEAAVAELAAGVAGGKGVGRPSKLGRSKFHSKLSGMMGARFLG